MAYPGPWPARAMKHVERQQDTAPDAEIDQLLLQQAEEEVRQTGRQQTLLTDQTETAAGLQEPEPAPDDGARRRVWPARLLALFLALALLLLTFAGLIRLLGLPPLELLADSARLSKDATVRDWMRAVVAVSADDHRGTGFVLAPDQLVVTNRHIVVGASQATLHFGSGENHLAEVWHEQPDVDLAFFEMPADTADPPRPDAGQQQVGALPLADGNLPQAGETLTLIGNPLGFFRVVSQVSFVGLARTTGISGEVLAVRGAVYHGNSGSPVINADGAVVGILFAVVSEEENPDNIIGLLIPAATIQAALGLVSDETGKE